MSVATTVKLSMTYRSAHFFFPGEEVWQLRTDPEIRPFARILGLGHISLVLKFYFEVENSELLRSLHKAR